MASYFPGVFDTRDLSQAKRIILTNEGPGADTDTRWAAETPYLIELIGQTLRPSSETTVLDYGCGVGRLSKAMIEAFGCAVVGVDISPTMRAMAHEFVASERFLAVAPGQLDTLLRAGLRVSAAIAVWVLQHCFQPAEDIARIGRALAPAGRVFVLNMKGRAVPAVREREFLWARDGVDVAALLRHRFLVDTVGEPDPQRMPATAGVYWMSLREPPQQRGATKRPRPDDTAAESCGDVDPAG